METAITLSSSKERDQNVTIRSMKNFFVLVKRKLYLFEVERITRPQDAFVLWQIMAKYQSKCEYD